jgi:hypothetical protein
LHRADRRRDRGTLARDAGRHDNRNSSLMGSTCAHRRARY